MRLSRIQLKKFKRFDDLTIDLGDNPSKLVALVGPNGCGKSSVFDAFEEKLKDYKGARAGESPEFFSKFPFAQNESERSNAYDKNQAITILDSDGGNSFSKTSFYIRSAYRFTPKLDVTQIKAQPDIIDDATRPTSSIAIDTRFGEDYERLLGQSYDEWEIGARTGTEVRQDLLDRINGIIGNILDLELSGLGNVRDNRGQLYFDKSDARSFPYQNLSSGEKEVVNLIVDLVVKVPIYDDTVFCIDEPELHLNTAVQRNLLIEIDKLIPETCQLWIATHSVGFLRALQCDLDTTCSIFDFSERDYFSGQHVIHPMQKTRANWQRLFSTALDDLVGLLAPQQIIYCEGRCAPTSSGEEGGLDAVIYNKVFESTHAETLFVSSGGTAELQRNSSLALRVLSKAFLDVDIRLLRDRDELSDEERNTFVAAEQHHLMLQRREVENYLFDHEVLHRYCQINGTSLDTGQYRSLVQNIRTDDLKLGQTQQQLKHLCRSPEPNIAGFKKQLAECFDPSMSVYAELDSCIFGASVLLIGDDRS